MTTLFEYMIANTDVSLSALHNLIVVQTKAGQRYMVPYDFDYAGLVDGIRRRRQEPRHHLGARPAVSRSVQDGGGVEPYFARFRAAKPAIMAPSTTIPDLPQSYRNKSKSYLEEFYKTLDRPSEFKRTFVETCKPYM